MPKAKSTATPAQAKPQEQATPPQPMQAGNPMQFDVRIYPVKTDGTLKANASVNINGFFAVSKVRI